MLSEEQIRGALKASRVVTLEGVNPHGPFGLERLAEVVARLGTTAQAEASRERIVRPLALPVETWEKLDQLAQKAASNGARQVSASAVAAALLEQCMADS